MRAGAGILVALRVGATPCAHRLVAAAAGWAGGVSWVGVPGRIFPALFGVGIGCRVASLRGVGRLADTGCSCGRSRLSVFVSRLATGRRGAVWGMVPVTLGRGAASARFSVRGW